MPAPRIGESSKPRGACRTGGRLTDDQAVTESSVMGGVSHGKRKGNSGTHRVMTGLFLELAGRLPVLNHGHQSHRERR